MTTQGTSNATADLKDVPRNCPECGESLENRDPAKHSAKHYGAARINSEMYPERAKRQASLTGEKA